MMGSAAISSSMTPIIETIRSLLAEGTAGSDIWIALAWIPGILVVSYTLALGVYRRSEPRPGSPVGFALARQTRATRF
jgi:hypothetical protein